MNSHKIKYDLKAIFYGNTPREIVRNIQEARKQLDCEISDRIKINLEGKISENSIKYICNETLSEIDSFESPDFECEVSTNGETVKVKISK